MSRSLRLFVRFMAALLVTAIAAPFYLTGPGGRPLLTLDRITAPMVLPPAVAEVFSGSAPEAGVAGPAVYRWQDEYGIWQFGEAPPEGTEAEAMEVTTHITPLGEDWRVDPVQDEPTPSAPALTGNPLEVYARAPELIDSARQAARKMEEHNEQLRALAP